MCCLTKFGAAITDIFYGNYNETAGNGPSDLVRPNLCELISERLAGLPDLLLMYTMFDMMNDHRGMCTLIDHVDKLFFELVNFLSLG